jgi:pimeloyl-ACP methyl ester carboxylesterase
MTVTPKLPNDRFIDVNGLRLHYLDWGTPKAGAQPMLLLHGYTGHAHTWGFFAPAMKGSYHVIALDQRGHGDSAWAQDGYSHERMVSDIEGFAAALGLERLVLIGLSMGGLNAMGYMGRGALRVDKLVIVDIGPEIMAEGAGRIRTANGTAIPEEFDSQDAAYQFMRSQGGFRTRRRCATGPITPCGAARTAAGAGSWTRLCARGPLICPTSGPFCRASLVLH